MDIVMFVSNSEGSVQGGDLFPEMFPETYIGWGTLSRYTM